MAITQESLKDRARALLVAMTERGRFVYALPREESFAKALAMAAEQGLKEEAREAEGSVVKFVDTQEQGAAHLIVFDNAALDVVLMEGASAAVVPVMQAILEETGFVPQSGLWASALDIGEPGCGRALAILAHMAVAWDDDWTDLFLLHLASPDALVRREVVGSLTLAAMVCGDAAPALELLGEARRRERFPKLTESIDDAVRVLKAFVGETVELGS
jgi:hypothetical protein